MTFPLTAIPAPAFEPMLTDVRDKLFAQIVSVNDTEEALKGAEPSHFALDDPSTLTTVPR